MSSKGVKSSKRRTTNEAPTQLHQLNDATTRRIEQTTYDKVMNFKLATTFADEDRKKTAPLVMLLRSREVRGKQRILFEI